MEKKTEPIKHKKRKKRSSEGPSPDKPLVKCGKVCCLFPSLYIHSNIDKLPYLILFYPHALLITKAIRKGTKFSICVRIDILPSTEIVPVGESGMGYLFSVMKSS